MLICWKQIQMWVFFRWSCSLTKSSLSMQWLTSFLRLTTASCISWQAEEIHHQLLALQSKGTKLITKDEMALVVKSEVYWRKVSVEIFELLLELRLCFGISSHLGISFSFLFFISSSSGLNVVRLSKSEQTMEKLIFLLELASQSTWLTFVCSPCPLRFEQSLGSNCFPNGTSTTFGTSREHRTWSGFRFRERKEIQALDSLKERVKDDGGCCFLNVQTETKRMKIVVDDRFCMLDYLTFALNVPCWE